MSLLLIRSHRARWFCLLVFVVACGPRQTVLGTSDDEVDPAFVQCVADEDCELVEMACCDTCNGGWSMSVRRGQVDAAKNRWGGDCTGQVVCTERGCAPADEPVCVEERCAVRLPMMNVIVHNPRRKDPQQRGWPPGVGPNGRLK